MAIICLPACPTNLANLGLPYSSEHSASTLRQRGTGSSNPPVHY